MTRIAKQILARSRRGDEGLPGVTRGAATKRSRNLRSEAGQIRRALGVRAAMRRAVLALALLIGFASTATAETPIPAAPTRWVTDQSHFVSDATRSALDARLERYQHATGHQVIVWIG